LVTRPPNVSPVEASGIALAGQTAYQALIDIGQLEPGQTILVNGGSSAVGAFAIQIAKAKGAKVVATASTKNQEFVQQQGADEASTVSFPFNLCLPFIYDSSLTTPRALCMNTLPPILLPQSSI
jgi:NADPH:quinone reductase-like Zn-dependent oxidoreductase